MKTTLRKMKLVDTPTKAERRGKLNSRYLMKRRKNSHYNLKVIMK